MSAIDPHIEDFTQANYRHLLQAAKSRWTFGSFEDYREPGRRVLWRHDVDFSVPRARALASIEAEEGVRATYFFMLNSWFYNLLDDVNVACVREIAERGHDIGIHWSPAFYASAGEGDWEDVLGFEAQIFKRLIGVEPRAFSIHNPDVGPWLSLDSDRVHGLVNAYGKTLKETHRYCSDSNGYWRFDRLADVLAGASEEKLHVLTHPGWWVEEACAPRERVQKAIDERAASTARRYDEFLQQCGRINVS